VKGLQGLSFFDKNLKAAGKSASSDAKEHSLKKRNKDRKQSDSFCFSSTIHLLHA